MIGSIFLIFGARPTMGKNASLVLKAGTFRPKYLFRVWALWPKNVQLTDLFLLKRMVQHFFYSCCCCFQSGGQTKTSSCSVFSYLNVYLGKEHHHHLQGVRLMLSVLLAQKHHDHAEFFPLWQWELTTCHILWDHCKKFQSSFSCIGQEITMLCCFHENIGSQAQTK